MFLAPYRNNIIRFQACMVGFNSKFNWVHDNFFDQLCCGLLTTAKQQYSYKHGLENVLLGNC